MKKQLLTALALGAAGFGTQIAHAKFPGIDVNVELQIGTAILECGDDAVCVQKVKMAFSGVEEIIGNFGIPSALKNVTDFGNVAQGSKDVVLKTSQDAPTIHSFTDKDGRKVFVALEFVPKALNDEHRKEDQIFVFVVDSKAGAMWPANHTIQGLDMSKFSEGQAATLNSDGTVSLLGNTLSVKNTK